MKPQDFVHELNRMCTYYNGQCEENHCELDDIGCYINGDTKDEDFAKMYDTVAAWSDTHPIRTRQSEFLKMFPNARTLKCCDGKQVCINICPNTVCVDKVDSDGCVHTRCIECKKKFWFAPFDEKDIQDE